ncbi:bromodomain protein, putative [Plasmodium yoelii]|uniref:Bromodomain protein 3 n=2 Tax=Plasmodium yoelii TaxID=5861 RepID=A0AAE9WQJ9_PLAYO|nr:bromodomain protein, putative [Plasmodium yoelii]WBY54694.1 bromodomain protein 3 [Plasmodium yoelii yoelii]VTZ71684.1 bromodomain protein, putative [Plasmodium yoelii]|eukprot:XP_022811338.2 bromodomain protein, putative [Plasmodium yoelii]
METRRSLRVKKQDSEEKGSKKKSTEIANTGKESKKKSTEIANKGKEKKQNESKPNEKKPNEKKQNESKQNESKPNESKPINSGTNVNRKKVQENESVKNKNVTKPRIGLRKQASNSDIINSSEYAEKEKVSELKNENKIVEKPSKRNKSKDEHKEAGNAKAGKKMEEKAGKKMEANQTAINRGNINRGSVDRGSVNRGSVDRASVDRASVNRGSVDRASVDRASVDRASVDRGSVDRGNINRSIKRRLSQLLDRLKKEKLFQCLNDISDYSEIFIDNKEKKENEKDVEIVKCIDTSLTKKINVDIIHSKLHYEMYKNENEFNNDILLLFDNSIDVIKSEKKKKEKKKLYNIRQTAFKNYISEFHKLLTSTRGTKEAKQILSSFNEYCEKDELYFSNMFENDEKIKENTSVGSEASGVNNEVKDVCTNLNASDVKIKEKDDIDSTKDVSNKKRSSFFRIKLKLDNIKIEELNSIETDNPQSTHLHLKEDEPTIADKVDKVEKVEKADKAEKVDKIDKTDKAEKADKTDKVEKADNIEEECGNKNKRINQWENILKNNILKNLKCDSNSVYFTIPVLDDKNINEEIKKEYKIKIKKPMDYTTVSNNLLNGIYNHPNEIYNDIKLIYKNCLFFNPDISQNQYIINAAKNSDYKFENLWNKWKDKIYDNYYDVSNKNVNINNYIDYFKKKKIKNKKYTNIYSIWINYLINNKINITEFCKIRNIDIHELKKKTKSLPSVEKVNLAESGLAESGLAESGLMESGLVESGLMESGLLFSIFKEEYKKIYKKNIPSRFLENKEERNYECIDNCESEKKKKKIFLKNKLKERDNFHDENKKEKDNFHDENKKEKDNFHDENKKEKDNFYDENKKEKDNFYDENKKERYPKILKNWKKKYNNIIYFYENIFDSYLENKESYMIKCENNTFLSNCFYFQNVLDNLDDFIYIPEMCGKTNIQNGENMTKNGENMTKNGENMTKNGENMTKNGENMTKNGENMTKNGENIAKNVHVSDVSDAKLVDSSAQLNVCENVVNINETRERNKREFENHSSISINLKRKKSEDIHIPICREFQESSDSTDTGKVEKVAESVESADVAESVDVAESADVADVDSTTPSPVLSLTTPSHAPSLTTPSAAPSLTTPSALFNINNKNFYNFHGLFDKMSNYNKETFLKKEKTILINLNLNYSTIENSSYSHINNTYFYNYNFDSNFFFIIKSGFKLNIYIKIKRTNIYINNENYVEHLKIYLINKCKQNKKIKLYISNNSPAKNNNNFVSFLEKAFNDLHTQPFPNNSIRIHDSVNKLSGLISQIQMYIKKIDALLRIDNNKESNMTIINILKKKIIK